MSYRESQVDKSLRAWFATDYSRALLKGIRLSRGAIRGINSLSLEFSYPISAFSGVNGAGKSTILALACCAFHNGADGYRLRKRALSYYTFKDFFIQHADEVAPQGVEVQYAIAHNNWRKTERFPDGTGVGVQSRKKKRGGKWNDYAERVRRNVVFLGIERIVPHSERSQSKSYSRSFKDAALNGWEGKVKDVVGAILGKAYDDFRYLEYSKYNLPLVKSGGVVYSGFNMGAGENALFEIFSTIYSCGKGALLVLDEIELGLHARAQRAFINKLKDVCNEMRVQVICTTHSREIFDCLPDDARFFVESVAGRTRVSEGVSADFAFSKLGGQIGSALDIFVEDPVAQCLVLSCLPASIRARVDVKVIGSATAISRQLAAHYVRKESKPVLAIFDGDQKAKASENLRHARSMAEAPDKGFDAWFKSSCTYLPGETWPEAWMLQSCADAAIKEVASSLFIDEDEVRDVIEYGLQAGKHNEFYEISQHVGLGAEQCMSKMCDVVVRALPNEFELIRDEVSQKLK